MIHRKRLPNRRRCKTQELVVGNLRVIVTIGFDRDGRPGEVF